ncbi:MAG TPA: S9 family peptidase [Burkholderiales bacterium]|nr:S9 family peptidase [Burkholderiales bacterium]
MIPKIGLLQGLVVSVLAMAGIPVQAGAGALPISAFASLAPIESPRLSPSGKYVAFIRNLDGKAFLVTQELGARDSRVVLKTDNKKYHFHDFQWAGDDYLLVGASYREHARGVLTMETRMLAVDRQGATVKPTLVRSAADRRHVPQFQDVVIGSDPADSKQVLVSLDLDTPTRPDVYRLNVQTGRKTVVERNPGTVYRWMADRQGVVRAGYGWYGKTMSFIVKPPGRSGWTVLSKFDGTDAMQRQQGVHSLLGFDADARWLYASAYHQGRLAIFRIDIADPAFARQLVAADPGFDISGELIYAPWLGKVVGAYYEGGSARFIFWEQGARDLQGAVDRVLPERVNLIESSSEDGRRHVIRSEAGRHPPRHYLLDTAEGTISKISDDFPALHDEDLVQAEEVSFRSRDGWLIQGYLTRPAAAAAPMIVFPHGGPVARDTAAFNYWTQFFASRGWNVLQINFRGSWGFGHEFMTAGFRRWGLEMQDDITDGVRWAIERGIADPGRICIVGGSYGGYAALMGVAKTPALYRCAVSFAGLSDLRDFLSSQSAFLGYELGAEQMIGKWWGDRERLRQTSPVNHAGDIRTPLLIIHGEEDYIVPVSQSRDMVAALKRAGAPCRYLELPLGDHYLSREEDRLKAFAEMEAFLKAYLD